MSKPFLSFEAQIKHLQDNKNLVITNETYARSLLENIGYFSLIGGYKMPFINKTTRKYQDGTTIEAIEKFYCFDEELRKLFLEYILRIERHVRSLLSYYFTEKYGERQEMYLDVNNYHKTNRSVKGIERLVYTLRNMAYKNSDYPYVNHQRTVHHNIPLWVMVNTLSLGTLSKFYEYTMPDIQTKVVRSFLSVNEKQLEQFLRVMTKYRNVCAHGERLYCYRTKDDIPDTLIHAKLAIKKKKTQYMSGKRDLFAVVIAFRYLLGKEDFKRFKRSLVGLVSWYLQTDGAIAREKLYDYMGFPDNWKSITRYKK